MSQKDYWEKKWAKRATIFSQNYAKRCLKKIKEGKYKSLLDLGCGEGSDSILFAKKGLNVTSLDFSEIGIQKLKEKIEKKGIKNIITVRKDIKKLNFKKNSFDVIYSNLSLHYFDDKITSKIFDKLFDILKPKGIIFIRCKSIDDNKYGKGEKIDKDTYNTTHLIHFFSKEYMEEKLQKFKIVQIRKTSSKYYKYKSNYIEAIARKL